MRFSRKITTVGHNSVQTLKPALFPENPPQEAISLFGPLWGGVAENTRLSRFLPQRANSQFGPVCPASRLIALSANLGWKKVSNFFIFSREPFITGAVCPKKGPAVRVFLKKR
jgi:hypothetical protein